MLWCKGSSIPNRILRTLHAPAPPPVQNHKKDVDSEQTSQDAPRASATTRPKPQQSRGFPIEFSGLSTHQPRHPRKTMRGSSIPNRLLAPRASATPIQNHEKGVHSEQNSQDTPSASAATRPKPQEGRRFRTEISGRSTRQRRHPPKTTRKLRFRKEI